MNIRGVSRSLKHNLLEYEELEDLFYSLPTRNIEFPKSPHVALRDKVITGLMVYQGLHPTSIKTLKLEHIELEKGIPTSTHPNAIPRNKQGSLNRKYGNTDGSLDPIKG